MTILRNFSITTYRTIQANKQYIVIKHKQNKTGQLIDMSVSLDSNISVKEFEKFSKYKNIEIETATIRKMKIKAIAVFMKIKTIVGAIVMIKEETYKYIREIPNFQSWKSVSKKKKKDVK